MFKAENKSRLRNYSFFKHKLLSQKKLETTLARLLKSLGTFVNIRHKYGEDEKMNCPKCRGKMYSEKYYDFVRSFDAWKCAACGELVDGVILSNRARSRDMFLG